MASCHRDVQSTRTSCKGLAQRGRHCALAVLPIPGEQLSLARVLPLKLVLAGAAEIQIVQHSGLASSLAAPVRWPAGEHPVWKSPSPAWRAPLWNHRLHLLRWPHSIQLKSVLSRLPRLCQATSERHQPLPLQQTPRVRSASSTQRAHRSPSDTPRGHPFG